MTTEEQIIATNLAVCTYLPGSFEKRFARNMAALAKHKPETELTEKQRDWLYKQLKRYRRQIPHVYNKYHPDNKQTLFNN